MNWTCEQVEEHLSDYVDRLLNASERSGFEAHLAACPRCAPLVKSVQGLVNGMHRLEPVEAPPRLAASILDQTLGPRAKKKGFRAWLDWLQPVLQPRFAYGTVSVLVTLLVVFQALGIHWRKPTLADLNPVNIYRHADRQAHLVYARGAKFITDLRVVYEIHSRLRPEAEPQPAPERKTQPGQSTGPEQKSPRELNRANHNRNLSLLACAMSALPAGSVQ